MTTEEQLTELNTNISSLISLIKEMFVANSDNDETTHELNERDNALRKQALDLKEIENQQIQKRIEETYNVKITTSDDGSATVSSEE